MQKAIRLFLLVLFIHLTLDIGNLSFAAAEGPVFYGEEVVVTALRLPVPRSFSPWPVEVIKAEDLKLTLADSLRDTTGTDVKTTGFLGSVASVRLRGSSAQQVLVLRDGMRINSPLLGMADMGDILMLDTEKVEVAKFPLSSIYGSDAVGGVVNVITRRPQGNEKEFTLSSGSYATAQYGLTYGNEFYGLKSLTLANYILSPGFRQNGDYSGGALTQKFAFEKWGNWELGLNYYKADKGVPGVPDTDSNPWSASTPGNRQKDENMVLSAVNEMQFGNLKQKINIYDNLLTQKYRQYNFFTTLFEDTEYRTDQYGLDFSQNVGPYLYGAEFRHDLGESPYAGNHAAQNGALFFQENLMTEVMGIVVGTRMDKHSICGYSMNPRVGASVKLPGDTVLRASAGTAFKTPTLNDLYWSDPIWQMYGNAALSPEKSQSLGLGAEKKFGESASLSLDYYRTSITDLILWDWDIVTNITQAKNVGGAETYGFEAKYEQKFGKGLLGFASATLQEVLDEKDITAANVGKLIPYSPRLKYSAGVKLLNNIALTLRYVGDRFADAGNLVKVPEYTLVDLSLKRDFGAYHAGLDIDNLFNQVYYESVGYHPVTYARSMYPMPGRRITVNFGGSL